MRELKEPNVLFGHADARAAHFESMDSESITGISVIDMHQMFHGLIQKSRRSANNCDQNCSCCANGVELLNS